MKNTKELSMSSTREALEQQVQRLMAEAEARAQQVNALFTAIADAAAKPNVEHHTVKSLAAVGASVTEGWIIDAYDATPA